MQTRKSELTGLVLAGLVFAINCMAFAYFFDADEQGYIDTQRGIDQYNAIREFFRLPPTLTVVDLFEVRFVQILLTLIMLGALFFTGLVTVEHLTLYLVWPYSAFLATKIKQEFILFPLAFIDLASTWRRELFISTMILLFSLATGEKNGVIIIAFRITAFILTRTSRYKAVFLTVAGIAASLLLDRYFDILARFVPQVAAYSYTRDVVNPEYSVPESAGVFLSSLHLGINPPLDYWFHLPFSALVLFFGWLSLRESDEEERMVFCRSIMASAVVFILFTSVTHAFQNARYYYFIVLMLFPRLNTRMLVALLIFSLLHTLTAVYVYEVLR
ncbi:MAG: hypothetical protein KDB00_15645 [Planctomycetales bacterium]|nr:hypothetical protein [Planctomycetales bacterium]